MPDESQFISGIFNYCDRWCERCAFTSRCRLFADEDELREEANAHNEEANAYSEEENADFWETLEDVTEGALSSADEDTRPDLFDEADARDSLLDELTERDPLVRLSHDYSFAVHHWLQAHEADLPSEQDRFRAHRDAITPAEALEVISWHGFQITAKLSRATRGRLEAAEDAQDSELWDAGSNWQDEDEDEVDMAEIHQSDADGSAKVALLGIERSLGAWTILRAAYPQEDTQIQNFLRQLTRLRRMLDQVLPGARTFHRPGFDD